MGKDRPATPIAKIDLISRELIAADTPEQVIEIEAKIEAIEAYVKKAGLFSGMETMRPINEARMRARWKLGQLLSKLERGSGPGRGKKIPGPRQSFLEVLKRLALGKTCAQEAQRIGSLPEAELAKAFGEARERETLNSIAGLIEWARPWWYKENRERKHRAIADAAMATGTRAPLIVVASKLNEPPPDVDIAKGIGPFPLIYADPPWKFEVYSDKGLERTPDQHYPTLTDEEIKNFLVQGKTIGEIAHKDAALLLWCTSSNVHRALEIMKCWGFEYKTQAVWDKIRSGLGLVFRNQHEVLLYGTRGGMPGPQHQPPSVFRIERGSHSAKPPEVREAIERMYPDFDAATRLELFARGAAKGWTSYGYEAARQAAE
jgi:N6-adenosine-specific RNA methylase IME4